jgi:NAD(P)H-flavin reductase
VAIIKKYQSVITKIENPFQDLFIVSFRSSDKPFRYSPGQFLHLALDEYDPSSQWPESRCFSMQTDDKDGLITITYAVKGTFTRRMAGELREGKELWLKLPYGELFSKSHNRENTVFIAGGTGVTPFLSLFASSKFCEYINPSLYLGIREQKFNLYEAYLEKAVTLNSSFKPTIVNQQNEGVLDIEKIFGKHGKDSTYFVSGPPVMIRNFKGYLAQNGVSVDNVRTDDWE